MVNHNCFKSTIFSYNSVWIDYDNIIILTIKDPLRHFTSRSLNSCMQWGCIVHLVKHGEVRIYGETPVRRNVTIC